MRPSWCRRLGLSEVAAAVLIAGLVVPVVSSCSRGATQLVVVVDTNLVAGVDFQCIGLSVSRVGDRPTYRILEVPAAVAVPFSFGVGPPGGDATQRVEVAAEALRTCVEPQESDRVVRRSARTGFLPQRALLLPLFLPSECGVGCLRTESCPASGSECVPTPTVEPTTLAPTMRGTELADASSADAGEVADAPISTECSSVRATSFGGLGVSGALALAPRHATGGWRVFWDTGTSTAFLDTVGGVNGLVVTSLPLATERLLPFGIVTLAGDDVQLVGSVEGVSSVVRWSGPAYDTPTATSAASGLRTGAVGALPGGELLVLVEGAAGARNSMWRLAMSGVGAQALGRIAPDDREVIFARRSDGALAAIAGGEGSCELTPLAADGAPGTPIPIAVEGRCARITAADLGAGRVLVAYVAGAAGAEVAALRVVTIAGAVVAEPITLGRARPTNIEAVVDGGSGAVRVVWQDDAALVTVAVSTEGLVGTRHCVEDAVGATTTAYESFRVAQRAGVTAVAFRGGTRGGVVLAEIAGP